MSQTILKLMAIVSFVPFLMGGCITAEDEAIEKARACVDNAAKVAFVNADAASTAAAACETHIASITTKEAQKVRFGIYLLVDKKLARIAEMVDAMKNNQGTYDGMTVALNVLVVTPASRGTAYVTVANGTSSTGIKKIASLINMAAGINECSSFGAGTAAAVQDAVETCAGTSPTLVANMAKDFKATACADTSDNTSTDADNPCNKAKAIVDSCPGGQSDAAIATCMANYMNQIH